MTEPSHEAVFYRRHYGRDVSAGLRDEINLDAVRTAYFKAGARYHLVERTIPRLASRRLLVELGCGEGDTIRYLAKVHGFEVAHGVDIIYPDEVETDQSGSVQFSAANLNQEFPFETGSVDLLVAMMVIEHLFDPFHALDEIRRVLAPDGIAVLSLPLVATLRNRLRLLFGAVPRTSVPFERWMTDREWDGNHLHYFTVPSIHQLCQACELEIIDTASVGSFFRIRHLLPNLLTAEYAFAVRARR